MSRAFVFPGQGSQAVGMGADLALAFVTARDVFHEVDEALKQNLSKLMREGPESDLVLTENAQPALMAVSLAVMRVLQAEAGLDLARDAAFVAGHSLGEYSALAAAGALSISDTARLLRAMRQSIAVPFTIKIRGGWDDLHLNAVEVARMAESEGVDAITVHPRTRSQRFTGKAPWAIIAEVVEAVRIPVTGNGDVHSMAEARSMVAETGCASVMIGRGALGSPWIFDESFDTLDADAQRAYKDRIIRRHMALIQEHCFDRYAMSQMKKHLAWYTEGLAHATDCRARIFQTRSPAEVWEVFQEYWEASVRPSEPSPTLA